MGKQKKKEVPWKRELATNRSASFKYEILETYEVGIQLKGTEVKSLRNHGGNLQTGYVKILAGELWLIGTHIAKYAFGNIHNHEEERGRKLLVHRREIEKWSQWLQEKGRTIVPLSLYVGERGKIKLRIGLARGKKLYDKRRAEKARVEKRTVQRALKWAR